MKTQRLTGLLLVCWMSRWGTTMAGTARKYSLSSQEPPPSSLVERDARLSTPQLVAAYGYPAEAHRVRTEDGYVLTLHRIPRRARGAGGAGDRPPVLLQHGVLCSSADWVVMGPGKGLAYLLSDAGYDVWMGNARGNRYSKGHEKALSKQRYWSFSFHEMGVYDLPAVIDYILERTGSRQLHYVGHSMGTTMFFVMASERPEYNAKVRLAVAMAPVAYLSHMRSTPLRLLVTVADQLGWLLARAGVEEVQPSGPLNDLARAALCSERATTAAGGVTAQLCANALFLVGGFDSAQLNRTMLPVIASHIPAGTSTKVFQHFAQIAKSGRFQQLDMGGRLNSARYGRALPPPYALHRASAPVALFTGDNDNLCAPQDVNKLHLELGHVIGRFRVPYSRFNHLDFLWANDAKMLVYDDVIRLLDKW